MTDLHNQLDARNAPYLSDQTLYDADAEPKLVIGIGASAGGLTALQQFFDHMPADSGMTFVVVVHLSAEHESSLPELLQRHTTMRVLAVTETVAVEPNHVYVIPPAKNLAMEDGTINLFDPVRQRGRRVPIDLFFRTLAEAHGHNAAAIVLSGGGSDGTLGLMRVKEFGGITFAQDLEEAEHETMPYSAIKSGMVDFVLPVADIPKQLVEYQQRMNTILGDPTDPKVSDSEGTLREVLALLRARTGHDFSDYKRSTLLRRIQRRLQVNGLNDLSEYPAVLREQPAEVQALLRNLLISVTNFFRDPVSFEAVNTMLPDIFADKTPSDQVRVWVAGCATGEEAYSIAIQLYEYATTLHASPNIQVFATDIDERAISFARDGVYVETIANDVSPERLRRFFTFDQGHYHIKQEIRDLVLFAPHNVLRDPPFSRLDLVTCRNLLIYLNRDVQQQVLALFHFALRSNGFLFLGASETADGVPTLFSAVDKQQRLFRRRVAPSMPPPLPVLHLPSPQRRATTELRVVNGEQISSLSTLHQELLTPYTPPSVLINEDYDIVHLSSRATRWLQFVGEPSFNLLKVVHPVLRLEVRTALFTATQGERRPELRRVYVPVDGATQAINLWVQPLHAPEWAQGLILVVFEDVIEATSGPMMERPTDGADSVFGQLEDENSRVKEQLRVIIEQYETSTEELKASNEELQAMNEEFRATTEELETSKEELQSVNEELITVNSELKNKVDELSRSNSDLQNLFAATDIGTIFLDSNLNIKSYTPRIEELFNLIPSDVNRPLAHITHKLNYPDLADDAARVLKRLVTIEHEAHNNDDESWYLIRMLPYRTMDNKIDGVVITFIDITSRKQSEETLRQNSERFRLMYEHVRDYAIFTVDTGGCIQDWNVGAERIFGYAPVAIVGQPFKQLFTPEDVAAGASEHELTTAATTGSAADNRWHVRRDGSRVFVNGVTTTLYESDGTVRGYLKIGRDGTQQKQAEEQLQQSYAELEQRVEERTHDLYLLNTNLESEIAMRQRLERDREQVLRQLMNAQEEEQRRISRELHDQLGQQLTALQLGLKSLEDDTSANGTIRERLGSIQELANTLSLDLHQIMLQLRPSTLDDLGLEATLENYATDWASKNNILLEIHTTLGAVPVSTAIATTVYRVVQEALNNVLKHADASRVSLIVEQRDSELITIVEDNGCGFDSEAVVNTPEMQQRLGLIGMRERVTLLQGTLTIESEPDTGTTVLIRIPLNTPVEEPSHG